MKQKRRFLIAVLFVSIVSFSTHLPKISHPSVVVFDETHFGGFVSDYARGVCYFDIHPPLAKLMLFGVAKAIGYKGDFNFSNTDTSYYEGNYKDKNFFIYLRLLPAICSSLVGPMLTAALMIAKYDWFIAILPGLLFSFDFISITQGRLILTDGILYFFVALTILATSLMEKKKRLGYLFLQAFAAGCTISIKFTGCSVLVYIAFSHFKLLFGKKRWFYKLVLRGIIIFITCVTILFTTVAIHLKLMPKKGYGDLYMEANFRKLPMLKRVIKLIIAMYTYNRDLRFTHPYQSYWYQWPFSISQPILLYLTNDETLYLFNNPIAALVSFAGFILSIAVSIICNLKLQYTYSLGYLFSYFPFILIARCTFVYHYEIPLIFGLMCFSHFLKHIDKKKSLIITFVVLFAAILAYVFWFKWIYAIPASKSYNQSRMFW